MAVLGSCVRLVNIHAHWYHPRICAQTTQNIMQRSHVMISHPQQLLCHVSRVSMGGTSRAHVRALFKR